MRQLRVHIHMCTSADVRWCQCINSGHLFLLEEYCGSLCKLQYMLQCWFIFSVTCQYTLVLSCEIMQVHICLMTLRLYVVVSRHINSIIPLVFMNV